MHLDTPQDVAMILPLPVAAGTGEDGVKFHAFDGYPFFFRDLETLFRPPQGPVRTSFTGSLLKVVEVGAFNASFVPTVNDFGRLDAQFRLPDAVWKKVGDYAGYGFAVFKLRKGKSEPHPMAFDFPTALDGKLFFPTVHIHDGEVHPRAKFDHILYAQPAQSGGLDSHVWLESAGLAESGVRIEKTNGLVDSKAHVYRRLMVGELKNEDFMVAAA
jgi:hypothetical protein